MEQIARRAFIAGAALASVGSAPASAVHQAGHDDVGLVELCRRYLANENAYLATLTADEHHPDLSLLNHAGVEMMEQIAATPATTPLGLACKARSVQTWMPKSVQGNALCPYAEPGERMMWSLCEDILLGAARGSV